ncbi:OmpA family protein [Pedobacter nototheniae]|uniref:OmpA family protein n=1 Tax=Pedobacter nototheniae TaxID=2488994 RepID=UPI00103F4CA7|nr:OmpA family protein [Pedobacter nototheniae]
MKKTIYLLAIFLVGTLSAWSQTTTTDSLNRSGFRASIRAGYDILPMYKNNTPYIDYKGGLELGASVNYYWNWIGLGADFDYIKNKPKSTYPTSNLFNAAMLPISGFNTTEASITRMFYGIGPSFKYQPNNRFDAELYLRGGLGSVKGGLTALTSTTPAYLLNYHAGYDAKNVPSAKLQLQFNYFFTPSLGINVGAYYLTHFNVKELNGSSIPGFNTANISSSYYSIDRKNEKGDVITQGPSVRAEPCKCNISSIGAFAGIVFKPQKKQVDKCPVCNKRHYPQCCQTCGCSITVTARDKYTRELLPNTDVVLTNEKNEIVQTGTTNTYGVVVFNNILPKSYGIKGKLYDVPLEIAGIAIGEFEKCRENGGIQKEILYSDENFILKGKVVQCNTAIPLSGASVVLNNSTIAEQKSTVTDTNGEFIFHVTQNVSYNIYGKKNNYFSQTETVTTKDFDRKKTLFIKLEVCMEKVDCGAAIVLKNILYDLDKYFIREDAKPDLNRLVQFMKDNPNVKVELSSHTDSRASFSYNNTLSQNRANAAVDYIVSQGIERSRLIGKGYGESKLLNRCKDGVECTEAEHQINRRTEMKVICPDNK